MNKYVKALLSLSVAMTLLAGCEEEQPVAKIENVTVINKSTKDYSRAGSEYFVTVQKNENTATFEVDQEVFNAVTNGTIISGNQYRTNQLKDVTLPKLK